MDQVSARICDAHADTADFVPFGDDWAVVRGVPCQHIDLPHPWATTGRVLVRPGAPEADTLAEVAAWLQARASQWSLLVRAADAASVVGFQPWELMPVLVLDRHAAARPDPSIEIGPPHDAAEFLVPYGFELAPLVTAAHLAAPRMRHLVARLDGHPVGCARVRLMGDTAQLGAITVAPDWRGKGVGGALTVAASELAASLSDLVWLHCSDTSRALYERLGYRHADDHVLLVTD